MRIGILGGTFDPIHNGHLYLAEKVLKKLCLKKVIFIPTRIPPHKSDVKITSARHRYNMVMLAIARKKCFNVSDIEIKRKGRSYSVETLKRLRKRYGSTAEIFFITGSDSLKELNKWKNLKEILRLCNLVVVRRPGFGIKGMHREFIVLSIDAKNISSSDIRKRIKRHKSVKKSVPKKVLNYIKKNKLYQANLDIS